MVTYNLDIESGTIALDIPLGEYLLDDEKVAEAKKIVEGVHKIAHQFKLILNGDEISLHGCRMEDIIERHRSLYLLSLIDDLLNRVRPINDPHVNRIDELVQPVLEISREELKRCLLR